LAQVLDGVGILISVSYEFEHYKPAYVDRALTRPTRLFGTTAGLLRERAGQAPGDPQVEIGVCGFGAARRLPGGSPAVQVGMLHQRKQKARRLATAG
jgi:hypothetical protein